MGIQICHITVFIQRVLFDIQTRGIDVGTDQEHTVFDIICSDLHHDHGFFHIFCVNFISGFQLFSFTDHILQIFKTIFFCDSADIAAAFPFCFSCIQKFPVHLCQFLDLIFFCLMILSHDSYPFLLYNYFLSLQTILKTVPQILRSA